MNPGVGPRRKETTSWMVYMSPSLPSTSKRSGQMFSLPEECIGQNRHVFDVPLSLVFPKGYKVQKPRERLQESIQNGARHWKSGLPHLFMAGSFPY